MENHDILTLLPKVEMNRKDKEKIRIDYQDDDVVFIESLDRLPELYAGRLKVNVICSCNHGHFELDVSGTHYVIQAGEVFVCPSGFLVENMMVSPDFQFTILCLTDRIIQRLLSTNVDFWNRAVYVNKEHVIKKAISPANESMGYYFIKLLHALINSDTPFREEMVHTMLQMILLGFCSRQKLLEDSNVDGVGEERSKSPQSTIIFKRFMDLLKNEKVKHMPVYYYAEKLCISSKYLSFACKEVTGKSANEFIQMAVMDDITYYLRNTSLTVKEISVKMGFPNISFFGKYVKSRLGTSPNGYRKKLYEEKI